jgi:hypothetical protein
MTLALLPGGGLWYPYTFNGFTTGTDNTVVTMNAATRRCAFIGQIQTEGRGSKTLSTGKIWFKTGTTTFSTASSTVQIGIQGVDTTTGVPVRPDGSWSVSKTLTAGTDTISGSTWQSATMNSGTVTVANGDAIAIVFEMAARAGSDSVTIIGTTTSNGSAPGWPAVVNYNGTSWVWNAVNPRVMITFDDGTTGILACSTIAQSFTEAGSFDNYLDSSNPDEFGYVFQVPWQCKIDAIACHKQTVVSSSYGTLTLYSDPYGSPSSLATQVIWNNGTGNYAFVLGTEISLSANTNYCLALPCFESSNPIDLHAYVYDDANLAKFWPGSTTLQRVTRNNKTGAFSTSATLRQPKMAVRISQVNADASGGFFGAHLLGGSIIR